MTVDNEILNHFDSNDIVVSGISGRFPEADDIEQFWLKLVNGVELYTADDRRWPV
ncbi:fatty acid synthase-like protein, partial [Dinothrombium tinctorium]